MPDKPDAIPYQQHPFGAGVLLAICENKLKIPDDIAFASFDDTICGQLLELPITVNEQPTYEIGRSATELLIKRIQYTTRSNREDNLKTRLIICQSCGCQRL